MYTVKFGKTVKDKFRFIILENDKSFLISREFDTEEECKRYIRKIKTSKRVESNNFEQIKDVGITSKPLQ